MGDDECVLPLAQSAIDRIFDNVEKGKGVRLSYDECRELTFTFLVQTQEDREPDDNQS